MTAWPGRPEVLTLNGDSQPPSSNYPCNGSGHWEASTWPRAAQSVPNCYKDASRAPDNAAGAPHPGLNPRPAQAFLPPSSTCHVCGRATTLSYYSSRCNLPRITADAGNYLIQKPAFLLHLPMGPRGEPVAHTLGGQPRAGGSLTAPPGDGRRACPGLSVPTGQ